MTNEELVKLKIEAQETKEDLRDLEIYIKEFSFFLPLAVCTANHLGVIIDVNQAFQNLTGYDPMKIVGESLDEIFLEKKELSNLLTEVQEKKIIQDRDFTLISSEKKEIPTRVSISIKEDKDKNFTGYFLAISDITEIKEFQTKLEEKVKEKTAELEEERTLLKIRVEARTQELKEVADGLDEQVKEKTKELQERIEELEKFNKLTVGRELKMIELKEEVKKLKEELEK